MTSMHNISYTYYFSSQANLSIYHLHTVLVEEKKRLSHYTLPSGDLEESLLDGKVVVVVIDVMVTP